jgi:DNA-binding transcriptional regulator YiaG
MSTFAQQLKNEVARISRKEMKAEMQSLKKFSAQYRSDIAALKRRVASLESLVKKLSRQTTSSTLRQVEETDGAALRFRAGGFATLRKKLGLSAQEMGQLLGVTGQTIYLWESGKSKPRAAQLQAIAKVRKMGKREARAQLSAE